MIKEISTVSFWDNFNVDILSFEIRLVCNEWRRKMLKDNSERVQFPKLLQWESVSVGVAEKRQLLEV